MARIRTIKPEFFTDSKITKLTPLARLFYVSLWCEADKQGRLKWDPETLKYRYLPADKVRIETIANELIAAKLIRLYEIDDVVYCDIPGFVKHQVINNRESESSLPAFSSDACLTRESGVSDAACGKEGRKGREGKEGTAPIVPRGDEYPKEFLDLMEAYPKRDGTNPKKPALKAWQRVIDRGYLPIQIIDAARHYAKTNFTDRKFIQQTATWLNGDTWMDYLTEPVATDDSDVRLWEVRLKGWQRSKFWRPDLYGPPPGEPGCKVPPHLLVTAA